MHLAAVRVVHKDFAAEGVVFEHLDIVVGIGDGCQIPQGGPCIVSVILRSNGVVRVPFNNFNESLPPVIDQ